MNVKYKDKYFVVNSMSKKSKVFVRACDNLKIGKGEI